MKKLISILIFFVIATDATAFTFSNPFCKLEYNSFSNEFSISESCYQNFFSFSLTCRPTAKETKNLSKQNNLNEGTNNQATEVYITFLKAQEKKRIVARDVSGKIINGYSLSDFSKELNNGMHRKCEIGYPVGIQDDNW